MLFQKYLAEIRGFSHPFFQADIPAVPFVPVNLLRKNSYIN